MSNLWGAFPSFFSFFATRVAKFLAEPSEQARILCLGNKNKRVCFVFLSTFRNFAP